jgi:hypothetical protein
MLGLVPLLCAALSGCAAPVCGEAAAWPPGVWLDPTPWLAAHPGMSLSGCLDGTCKTAVANSRSLLQLILPASASPAPGDAEYRLTVSWSTSSRTTRTVRLVESKVSSSCGTQTWWQADARVDSAGHVTVWHSGVGPFPVAVRAVATPSPG